MDEIVEKSVGNLQAGDQVLDQAYWLVTMGSTHSPNGKLPEKEVIGDHRSDFVQMSLVIGKSPKNGDNYQKIMKGFYLPGQG